MIYTTYLFDFDYTLADSSKGIVLCFRQVLDKHGYDNISDDEIKRTIGKTLEASFTILTGVSEMNKLLEFKDEYVKAANQLMNINTFLFPETVDVLNRLKKQGAKLGIISTKYRYRIKGFLSDYFPENFFDVIIGGEDVAEHKPSPEGLLKAIEQLKVNKSLVLYVGDSTVDAEAAQRAGVKFAGVLHGMTTKEELQSFPHYLIMTSLTELIEQKTNKDKYHKLQKYYRWFKIKQVNGFQIRKFTDKESTCKNCEQTYIGNYCNRCGQDKNTTRLRFSNILQNALSGFSSMDRGFGLTLLELLYRPGYLISDYLKGKRIRYFRPFQMLFILSAVYLLWAQILDPITIKERNITQQNVEAALEETTNELIKIKVERNLGIDVLPQATDSTSIQIGAADSKEAITNNTSKGLSFLTKVWKLLSKWINQNKAISILLVLPILALSTKWAFHKKGSSDYLNFTEHLFAQTYIACQILLISIVILAFSHKAKVSDIYDVPEWLFFLLLWLDYKQLFNKSWLYTLAKLLLTLLYGFIILISIGIIITLIIMGSVLI